MKKTLLSFYFILALGVCIHAQNAGCKYKSRIDSLQSLLPSEKLVKQDDINVAATTGIKTLADSVKNEDIKGPVNSIFATEIPASGFYDALLDLKQEILQSLSDNNYPRGSQLVNELDRIAGKNSNPFPDKTSFPMQRDLMAGAMLKHLLSHECRKIDRSRRDSIQFSNMLDMQFPGKLEKHLVNFLPKQISQNVILGWLGALTLLSLLALFFSLRKNKKRAGTPGGGNLIAQSDELKKIMAQFVQENRITETHFKVLLDKKIDELRQELRQGSGSAGKIKISQPDYSRRENKKAGTDRANETAAAHQQKTNKEIFYAAAPRNSLFYGSKLSKDFIKNQTIYKITILNENNAVFTFVSEKETLKFAFNLMDAYIIPAMDLVGSGTLEVDTISKVEPGKLVKDGVNWRIDKKGKISY